MQPKMNHTYQRSPDATRAANLSQLNIDASVLGRNQVVPPSVQRKNSDHPIKIPSCSSKEQAFEYLTDGSAGTEQNTAGIMRRTQRTGFERVRKVKNKSAYMKKNSL